MLVKMSKVEIIGAKELLQQVLHKIHEVGSLHIEDIKQQTEVGKYIVRPMDLDKESQQNKREIEDGLVKVSSLLDSLPPASVNTDQQKKRAKDADKAWREDNVKFLSQVRETVDTSEETIRSLNKEKKELLAEQGNLARYQVVMKKVAPLAGRIVALENYDSTALLVEKRFANLVELVRREVERITDNQSHMVADDVDENTIAVLIVFHNKYARQVRSFLSGESVNQVVVPENLKSLSYDEALRQVEKRRDIIPQRLKKIDEKLGELSESLYYTLLTQKEVLRDKLNEFEVLNQFGTTDYTFIIIGWLPSKRLAEFRHDIVDTFGDAIFMQELPITEHEAEKAPIEYVHSNLVKPFEPIVQMFGTPRYGTVDPVPLVAIFFPLFFGIILGDMGYALVLLGIAYYLRTKKSDSPVAQAMSIILFLSGISSFVFGFLYGEFFAEIGKHLAIDFGAPSHIHLGSLELPWNRRELLIPTLLFSIGLGVVHISLGLILGMVNAWRARSKRHLLEKGATLVALFALGPIVYTMLTGLPTKLTTPGWLALIAAIPVLVYSAGVMGPIEVLGTMANIVSYARIMAIGLVSVILAETANELGGQVGNIMIGALIAVLIHSLNLAIHVFTPSLHVLRLNFVEFFGKFYEPGGKPYKPFRRGGGV